MSESYIEWCPAQVDAPTVALQSLRDDGDGLTIRVEDGGRTIEISFGIVVAFRSTLEESCVDFWVRFHAVKPKVGPFWKVENSAWLASFSSADLCLYPEATHYLIITDDERVDVIAPRTPVVRIVDA